MKSNTFKKSPKSASVPDMQIADALACFDFSTGYPQWTIDQAAITDPHLQQIGLTLMSGIGLGVMNDDLELVKKCSMALRERLCFNVEQLRMSFQSGDRKIISMMSPFQLAVHFGRLDVCEYLFTFALTMPATALREGIDAPVPMICQLTRKFPQANPSEKTQITLMVQNFSERLAASLAQTNPEELDPASGMLFEPALLHNLGFAGPMITAALHKQSALLAQQALQKSTPQASVDDDSDPQHRL